MGRERGRDRELREVYVCVCVGGWGGWNERGVYTYRCYLSC